MMPEEKKDPTTERTMKEYLQEYYEYLRTSAEKKKKSFEEWMSAKAKEAASAQFEERVQSAMPVLAVGAAVAGAFVVGRFMNKRA